MAEVRDDDEPYRDEEHGDEDDDEEEAEDLAGEDAVLLLEVLRRVGHHRVEEDDDELRLRDLRDDVVVLLDVGPVVVVDAVGDHRAQQPDGDLGDGPRQEHHQTTREEDAAQDLVDDEHAAPRLELLVEKADGPERGVVRALLELLELAERLAVALERRVEVLLVLRVRQIAEGGPLLELRRRAEAHAPRVRAHELRRDLRVEPVPEPPEHHRERRGDAHGVDEHGTEHVGQPGGVGRAPAADAGVHAEHVVRPGPAVALVGRAREVAEAVARRAGHEDVEREHDPVAPLVEHARALVRGHVGHAQRADQTDEEDEDEGHERREEQLVEVGDVAEALALRERDEAQVDDGAELEHVLEDLGEVDLGQRPRQRRRDLVRRDDDLQLRHDAAARRVLLLLGAAAGRRPRREAVAERALRPGRLELAEAVAAVGVGAGAGAAPVGGGARALLLELLALLAPPLLRDLRLVLPLARVGVDVEHVELLEELDEIRADLRPAVALEERAAEEADDGEDEDGADDVLAAHVELAAAVAAGLERRVVVVARLAGPAEHALVAARARAVRAALAGAELVAAVDGVGRRGGAPEVLLQVQRLERRAGRVAVRAVGLVRADARVAAPAAARRALRLCRRQGRGAVFAEVAAVPVVALAARVAVRAAGDERRRRRGAPEAVRRPRLVDEGPLGAGRAGRRRGAAVGARGAGRRGRRARRGDVRAGRRELAARHRGRVRVRARRAGHARDGAGRRVGPRGALDDERARGRSRLGRERRRRRVRGRRGPVRVDRDVAERVLQPPRRRGAPQRNNEAVARAAQGRVGGLAGHERRDRRRREVDVRAVAEAPPARGRDVGRDDAERVAEARVERRREGRPCAIVECAVQHHRALDADVDRRQRRGLRPGVDGRARRRARVARRPLGAELAVERARAAVAARGAAARRRRAGRRRERARKRDRARRRRGALRVAARRAGLARGRVRARERARRAGLLRRRAGVGDEVARLGERAPRRARVRREGAGLAGLAARGRRAAPRARRALDLLRGARLRDDVARVGERARRGAGLRRVGPRRAVGAGRRRGARELSRGALFLPRRAPLRHEGPGARERAGRRRLVAREAARRALLAGDVAGARVRARRALFLGRRARVRDEEPRVGDGAARRAALRRVGPRRAGVARAAARARIRARRAGRAGRAPRGRVEARVAGRARVLARGRVRPRRAQRLRGRARRGDEGSRGREGAGRGARVAVAARVAGRARRRVFLAVRARRARVARGRVVDARALGDLDGARRARALFAARPVKGRDAFAGARARRRVVAGAAAPAGALDAARVRDARLRPVLVAALRADVARRAEVARLAGLALAPDEADDALALGLGEDGRARRAEARLAAGPGRVAVARDEQGQRAVVVAVDDVHVAVAVEVAGRRHRARRSRPSRADLQGREGARGRLAEEFRRGNVARVLEVEQFVRPVPVVEGLAEDHVEVAVAVHVRERRCRHGV